MRTRRGIDIGSAMPLLIPVRSPSHEFAAFIKKDRDFRGPIAKASGVALD
jgi:hypothetical protein